MEENRSIWKETLKYGLILGLISIVFSVLIYMLDLTLKPWIMWPSLLISLVALYFLLRSYRDRYNYGFISYGKSVGAGFIMNLYACILGAIFAYLLYAVIDPGLYDKILALSEEKLIARGISESQIEAGMQVAAKMQKPWISAIQALFGGAFFGLIMSLLVSLFVKKQGNPLLDKEETASNQ